MRSTLKDNDFALFAQPPGSSGGTGPARYPADYHQTSRMHLKGTEPSESQKVTNKDRRPGVRQSFVGLA